MTGPAVFQCPGCGGPVAYTAAFCPRCGWRPPVYQYPTQEKGPSMGGSITQGFGWACGCLLMIPAVFLILYLMGVFAANH